MCLNCFEKKWRKSGLKVWKESWKISKLREVRRGATVYLVWEIRPSSDAYMCREGRIKVSFCEQYFDRSNIV